MIKDLLGALGSWDVRLREGTPSEITELLDFFGHIAVVRGPVDVLSLGDKILPAARYVGVMRERNVEDGGFTLGGVGMAVWAGDEDGKGEVLQEWVDIVDAPLDAALYAVMPSAVTVGGIYNQPGKTYTGRHRFETPRDAMNTICAAFGVEWYISGDAKLYAGRTDQLYDMTPDAVVVRKGAGVDLDLTALGGKFAAAASVNDYTTRVVLLGQHTDFGPDPFITWVQDTPSPNRYFDMYGNPVKRTRLVSETFTTEGSIAARAQLQMNRFNRQSRSLKVTSEKYETEGNFRVGDFAYVYDPDSGIFDRTRQITFRGEVLHPDVIRVTGISYPISNDHTVAFRTIDGKWIDLTRWVVFETGTNEITVGDLPKSLGGGSVNVARDRADAATGTTTDTVAPAMPEAVQVSTSVVENARTGLIGNAVVEWAAVTANEDGSVLNDFANYVVAYRMSHLGEWKYAFTYEARASVEVTPGRNYQFRVAAQDRNGNTSDYSPTVETLTAADNVAPGAPADPTVTSYLGQLRIEWSGVTSTGAAMPPDFNRVDVHVSATSGFTPSAATLVSSLVTKGVAYATAPYGSARYVKLVAYDNSGNASQPSGQVTGTTVKAGPGDIASLNVGQLTSGTITSDIVNAGRFTTALTGARSEFNASGFYRFDVNNNALFAADANGILVTGRYRSAISGRRIEMGSAGYLSQIDFFAEGSNRTFIRSFTEASGIEAIQMGHGDPTTRGLDERININSGGHYTSRFRRHDFVSGEMTNFFHAATNLGNQWMGHTSATNELTWRLGKRWAYLTGGDYREAYDHRMRVYPAANVPVDLFLSHEGTLSFDLGVAYYGGRIIMDKSTQAFSTSPRLQFFTSQNYGSYIRFNGAGTYQDMEFKYFDDSFFINLQARAYIVQSDMSAKNEIVENDIDCLATVKKTKVKKYKRTRKEGKREKDEPEILTGREEIGLIAQEAPSQIVHDNGTDGELGIDLYQMTALLWGAIQELDARIDTLGTATAPADPGTKEKKK